MVEIFSADPFYVNCAVGQQARSEEGNAFRLDPFHQALGDALRRSLDTNSCERGNRIDD